MPRAFKITWLSGVPPPAAGITHLVLKPPHPPNQPGCTTPGTSSSNNGGSSAPEASSNSSSTNSSAPEASTSSSSGAGSSRSSGRCITPCWAELPCCLFLGAKLAQLESLEVHGAKLLVLPPCLQRMGRLRRLVLEGCHLQLSKEVFEYTQLQELRLAHNSMTELLDGDWGRLCRLQVRGMRSLGCRESAAEPEGGSSEDLGWAASFVFQVPFCSMLLVV
jgi:hypothetical protein